MRKTLEKLKYTLPETLVSSADPENCQGFRKMLLSVDRLMCGTTPSSYFTHLLQKTQIIHETLRSLHRVYWNNEQKQFWF